VTIRVRFFAIIRDKAGRASAEIDVPDGATVATAVATLQKTFPAIAPYVGRCAFAVNQSYVPADTVLHDGDELAVIPPVSGGCQ
jgi:molybdopterin converting factor subunit 1